MKNLSKILVGVLCMGTLICTDINTGLAKNKVNNDKLQVQFVHVINKFKRAPHSGDEIKSPKTSTPDSFVKLIFSIAGVNDKYIPTRLRWVKINNGQWKITRVK